MALSLHPESAGDVKILPGFPPRRQGSKRGFRGGGRAAPRGDLSEAELLERLSYLHPNRILEMQRRNLWRR